MKEYYINKDKDVLIVLDTVLDIQYSFSLSLMSVLYDGLEAFKRQYEQSDAIYHPTEPQFNLAEFTKV